MEGGEFSPTFFGPPNSDDELSRSSTAFADGTGDSSDDGFVCPQIPQATKAEVEPLSNASTPPTTLINGRAVFLSFLRQPELQHRARYMSEGSRGAVKGRHGKSHPTIQLCGYNRPTRVEVYAGTGAGTVGPHALYRAIPVVGKGGAGLTTPCKEIRAKDGLNCVQLTLRPDHKMTAVLDCVGILKICGHEMKRRLPKTGKNSSIRLVLRAWIRDELSGEEILVQSLSEPISCVQQLGFPEVQKMSRTEDGLKGGSELFILGKNFDKNTKVMFREWDGDGSLVWISEAKVERQLLHQCHLVCEIPTYKSLSQSCPVEVSLTVECGQKNSHPQAFTYRPDGAVVAVENGSRAETEAAVTSSSSQSWTQPQQHLIWTSAAESQEPPSHVANSHGNYLTSVIQMLEDPSSSYPQASTAAPATIPCQSTTAAITSAFASVPLSIESPSTRQTDLSLAPPPPKRSVPTTHWHHPSTLTSHI